MQQYLVTLVCQDKMFTQAFRSTKYKSLIGVCYTYVCLGLGAIHQKKKKCVLGPWVGAATLVGGYCYGLGRISLGLEPYIQSKTVGVYD